MSAPVHSGRSWDTTTAEDETSPEEPEEQVSSEEHGVPPNLTETELRIGYKQALDIATIFCIWLVVIIACVFLYKMVKLVNQDSSDDTCEENSHLDQLYLEAAKNLEF